MSNPELASTLTSVLLGVGTAGVHYRRTGRVPLSTLPLRAFRRLFYQLRRRFFTVPRPRIRAFQTGDTLEDIRERLGTESFEPAWPFSYKYHGEDLNARRYFYDPQADYPHRQLHIRGFQLADGTVELIAHEEPAPKHHPLPHLEETDIHNATQWLQSAWKSTALDPRTFDRQQTEGN